MRLVGGSQVFGFTSIFNDIGALATHCVTGFSHRGGQYHAVFTGDNVLIHDGQSVSASLDGRATREISNTLSTEFWARSYIVHNAKAQEIWTCYPTGSNRFPNKILVWNYREDTLSFLDTEHISWIIPGIIRTEESGIETWDTAPGEWADSSGPWNISQSQQHNLRLVAVSQERGGYWTIDDGDEMNLYRILEGGLRTKMLRTELAIVPNRQTREPILDLYSKKLLRGARVEFSMADPGQTLKVRLGSSKTIGGPVSYGRVTALRPDRDTKVNEIHSGVSFLSLIHI